MTLSRREQARRERGRIALEMTAELRERLEAAAAADETNISAFVRGCILERLERQRGATRPQLSQN
jgi:uncharacterized protein (DUF1778 family)